MNQAQPDPFRSIRADVAQRRREYLETVEPYRSELFRFARGLTRSPWDAEDLVQETLMRVFSGIGAHSGMVDDLRAYLFRVATNCWIDQQRRRRPAARPTEELETPHEEPALGPEVREALERIAIGLPPRERAAILLKEVFAFSLKDIAASLRTTVGAVKAALHRGRSKLAALCEPEPEEPQAVPAVVDAWVEAFNRRDVEGLLALISEDCQTVIPGVVDDFGKPMGRSVVTHTFGEKTLLRGKRVRVGGEPVVVLWYRTDEGEAIGDVVRIEEVDGVITRTCWYYFSPDVLEAVAVELGERCRTQGYCM